VLATVNTTTLADDLSLHDVWDCFFLVISKLSALLHCLFTYNTIQYRHELLKRAQAKDVNSGRKATLETTRRDHSSSPQSSTTIKQVQSTIHQVRMSH